MQYVLFEVYCLVFILHIMIGVITMNSLLLDLLTQRFSCRNFSDKKIPDELIKYIIECGRLSPSGGNEQPWKFGIVTDRLLIMAISDAASINYRQNWIAAAPLLIVLCTQLFDNPGGEVGRNRFPSYNEKLQSMDRALYARIHEEEHQTKIPGEHMVLAALEHGIYSTWISSVDCEKVGELIGIHGYMVSNVIAFGYPSEMRKPTPKKDLSSITFCNYFNAKGL